MALTEVKFDGSRCLAGMDSTGATLWARKENLFTSQFLHIVRACERLPQDTLIDGETVVLDENGRISFNLLQHHRSKAQNVLNRRGLLQSSVQATILNRLGDVGGLDFFAALAAKAE
jgi:ATP-dependent DNA ligase